MKHHYLTFVLAAVSLPLAAQNTSVNTRPDRGWLPTGVYSAAEVGTVNQVTGNLALRIPITGLPADRGGQAFNLELNYNSNLYDTSPSIELTANGVPYLKNTLGQSVHGGWSYNYNYGLELEMRAQPSGGTGPCGTSDPTTWRNFKMYFRTPDGALHLLVPFGLQDTNNDGFFAISPDRTRGGCPNSEPIPPGDMNYSTVDGTYIRVNIGYAGPPGPPGPPGVWTTRQWRAFFPDGSEVRGYAGASDTIVDRNGNEMRVYPFTEANGNVTTVIEDSVGRSIGIEALLSNGVKAKDIVKKFGFGGNPFTWEVNWGKVLVAAKRSNPSLEPQPLVYICGYAPDGGNQNCNHIASLPVVEKLSFPQPIVNSPSYTYDFSYASADSAINGWGELRTVSMPPRANHQNLVTRADVTFTYRWDDYNYQSSQPVINARNVTLGLDNPVASKSLSYHDGVAPRAERTSYSFTDTLSTMDDPGGQRTLTTFISRTSGPSDGFWARGLVYQIDEPLGRSTSRAWIANKAFNYPSANPLLSSEYVVLPTASGVNSSKLIRKDYRYDRNGNLRRLDEFDFTNANVRTTVHRYLFPTGEVSSLGNPNVSSNGGINDFAYWNPLATARAVNARFSTEVRTGNATGPLASYRESTFDGRWNVTESRAWDSTRAASITPGGNVPAQTPTATLNSSNSVLTKTQFTDNSGVFQKGNPTATFDANNNRTSLSYGIISGCIGANPLLNNLYPTSRVEADGVAVSRTFNLAYDCNTGVVTSEVDVSNGGLTSTTTYDGLGRPLVRNEVGLRTSRQTYHDSRYITVAEQDQAALNDLNLVAVTHSDDLGRPYLTRTTPDVGAKPAWNDGDPEAVGNVVKRLRYPACPPANAPFNCTVDRHRYEAVSNPYRAGQIAGQGWTRTRIDPLGRTVDVTTYAITTPGAMPPPWSGNDTSLVGVTRTGVTSFIYDADVTTVTDPAGKARSTRTDAFGRIAQVIEDPAGLNYSTTYVYDTLDNLTTVSQGAQTRTFGYSSLSRLISSNNPESGQMAYTYDFVGNLLTKTHQAYDGEATPAGSISVTTTMSYDALNRVESKSYANGGPNSPNTLAATPSVTYNYDTCTVGRGRLCSVVNANSTATFNYDALGRVVASTQASGGGAYLFRYLYNPAGGLTSVEYPSATQSNPTQPLKVSYNYNQANRVIGVRKGEAASVDTYLASATYWANGAPALLTMGNGVAEETTLNSLQQLTSKSAKRDTTTLWRSDLTYAPTNNNGNILNQVTSGTQVATSFSYTQTYEYDGLNRLSNVLDTGSSAAVDGKTQVFVYDRYGNRALKGNSFSQGGVIANTPAEVEAVFPNNKGNNCCNPYGDTKAFNGRSMTYDAEHRMRTVGFANGSGQTVILEYFYDGDGRRVRAEKKVAGNLISTTTYVYDASGQLMAEYTSPTPAAESNGRQYLTQDHLGSTRLVTKSTGTAADIVFSRHDFLPFGEELARGANGYGPSLLSVKFTGKERDAETGLDYSFARYLSSAQGRFTSPDAPFADQDSAYPQSWNLYSYVRNNPLRYIDPTGRNCVNLDNGTQGDDGQGTPCAGAQLGTTHGVTVGVGRDEVNLIMLQGIGEGLSSPHQIATIVSEAGQGAMMVSSVRSLPSLWRGLRSWWVGEGLIQLGIANSNGGVLAGAKFAQTTASAMFSSTGKFAGKSVDEVANALRSGSLHPADVPIEYAVRDGNTLILNTRSAMALEKAGIPRSNWNAINVTNDAAAQARLSGQLERNGLTSAGTDSVRMK